MLALQHIGKTYPNGVHALAKVSLDIELGEIVVIVGGSGCGKSTLLRAVSGLDQPTQGRVVLDGSAVTEPNEKIGIVFQEPGCCRGSASLATSTSVWSTGPDKRGTSVLRRSLPGSASPRRPASGRANYPEARPSVSHLRAHW
jgi:ABC-type uncharacterized transport system ATPase component